MLVIEQIQMDTLFILNQTKAKKQSYFYRNFISKPIISNWKRKLFKTGNLILLLLVMEYSWGMNELNKLRSRSSRQVHVRDIDFFYEILRIFSFFFYSNIVSFGPVK